MNELPKYVSSDPDRHGNERHYYRRSGRRIRLRSMPGTDEFAREIEAASTAIEKLPVRSRSKRHSVARLPMVYFVLYGNRRVKIGHSRQAGRRFAEISTMLPGKAKLHYLTPGGHDLEQRLHQMFATDRVSGEWFQYSSAIRDWIAADKQNRMATSNVALLRLDCLTSEITTSNQ